MGEDLVLSFKFVGFGSIAKVACNLKPCFWLLSALSSPDLHCDNQQRLGQGMAISMLEEITILTSGLWVVGETFPRECIKSDQVARM